MDFQQLATRNGLSEKTITILKDEELDSLKTLTLMEDSDVKDLKLSKGQQVLLRKMIADLRGEHVAISGSGTSMSHNVAEAVHDQPAIRDSTVPGPRNQTVTSSREAVVSKTTSTTTGTTRGQQASKAKKGTLAKIGEALGLSPFTKTQSEKPKTTEILDEDYITKCCSQLNFGKTSVKEVVEYTKEHGLDGLQKFLQTKLDEYNECPLNIAITGQSGVGKSSLINSLRGVQASKPGAAPVGVTETTKKITPYPFKDMKNALLWDVPGVNTPSFEKDSYLKTISFHKYDAFIIVSACRFTSDDLWLAEEVKEIDRPFYFVRTKIDIDVMNNKRDHPEDSEDQMLEEIRENIFENFDKTSKVKLDGVAVYLISSVLPTEWDYPKLTRDFLKNAHEKNKHALVMAIVTSSNEIIEEKAKALRERIDTVAIKSLARKDTFTNALQEEIELYRQRLGITQEDMERVSGCNIDGNIKSLVATLDHIINNPIEDPDVIDYIGHGIKKVLSFGLAQSNKEKIERQQREQSRFKDKTLDSARDLLNNVLDACKEVAKEVLKANKLMQQ